MSKYQKIENQEQWQKLLDGALFKTFFHKLEWENFLEQQFKWLKFERYNYQDKLLLSLARAKIGRKEKLISHPFCEYGGPLLLHKEIDFEQFKKDLFEQFKEQVKISFHPKNCPRTGLGQLKSGRNTYFIEDFDKKSEEQLWQGLRKTLRHSIRKAEKSGMEIKECADKKELKDFYKLYLKIAKKNKAPAYPFCFFEYFLGADDVEIVLAKYNSKIIAGSIFLFYDKFIHYFINASDKKYRNICPNYLIIWEQIKKYLGKDIQVFDFGGTREDSPLAIFKRGWGGSTYPILELKNYQEKPGKKHGLARKIWGNLPIAAIKLLSPHMLKYKF